MEVVMTTGAIISAKLQSNHHHQQTKTQLSYWPDAFLSHNQQRQITEGRGLITRSEFHNISTGENLQ